MVDFFFVFHLLEGKKLRNGIKMAFAEEGTEFNFSNFKSQLGLEDIMQASKMQVLIKGPPPGLR